MIERIPMVNVTARILDQQGRPVQRARVTMRLTTVEKYCGLIVPRETSQYTDANGVAVLRVWPNELGTEGSEYMTTIMYGDATSCPASCGRGNATSAMSQRFRVVVPNVDCDLFDITDLPPYEQRGSGSVITSEVAAYAAQAAANADRAQSAVITVETARNDADAFASAAGLARDEAAAASLNAQKEAQRAQAIVENIDNTILHFETCVVERTEKTATKLAQEAAACIHQAEVAGLEAIEKRSGEVLTEISREGADQKIAVRNAVNAAREAALADIEDMVNKAETDFREEATLFGADFEALTERAETAAKRAGCSAASAANSATKACVCAERAERAANGIEDIREDAEASARKAETFLACAEAAANRAERSADRVQQNVEWAAGSAKAAQEAARAADCSASLAKESADIATAAQQAAKADREYVAQVKDDAAKSAAIADEASNLAKEVLAQAKEAQTCIAADAAKAEAASTKAEQDAIKAEKSAATCAELEAAATQGAVESLQNAEKAKADAAKTAEDRKACEELARDVEQQIHDTALDILTEQVVNEAVTSATKDAQDAAKQAQDSLTAVEDAAARAETAADSAATSAQSSLAEAINSDNAAQQAKAAQKAAEETAAQIEEKLAEAEAMLADRDDLLGRLAAMESQARDAAKNSIVTMDRLTKAELALLSSWPVNGTYPAGMGPQGYKTIGGATVAPVTIAGPGAEPPAGAAFTLKLTEIETGV